MLKISNVETFYGKIQALRGVDLDVNDGERIMNDDSIYVFSKGRTTIKKFRLGSSDQHTNDGSVLAGEHRSFFSDTRPRLRTHDIFGRSLL